MNIQKSKLVTNVSKNRNFPFVELPPNFSDCAEYLRFLVQAGLKKRYGDSLIDEIQQRAKTELDKIISGGGENFILLIAELTSWCKRKNIAFLVRAGEASSIVNYALGITDIDPVCVYPNFETFLDIKSNLFSSILIQIDEEKLSEIVNHLKEKYGQNCVLRCHHNRITHKYNYFITKNQIRFTFIGFDELTILKKMEKFVQETSNKNFTLDKIRFDDEKTLDLFRNGKTLEIFQFDLDEIRNYLKEFQPKKFSDLVFLNTFYRSGFIELFPKIFELKKSKSDSDFFASVEKILQENNLCSNFWSEYAHYVENVKISWQEAYFFTYFPEESRKLFKQQKIAALRQVFKLCGCSNKDIKKRIEIFKKEYSKKIELVCNSEDCGKI